MNTLPKRPFWRIRWWEWLILIPAAAFVLACVIGYINFMLHLTTTR